MAETGYLHEYVGGRDAFLKRHLACQQLRFEDPDICQWSIPGTGVVSHLLFGEDNSLTVAKGSSISVWSFDFSTGETIRKRKFEDHKARITALRIFPLDSLGGKASTLGVGNYVVISASADHTVRVWGRVRPLRTFLGHIGPVTALADRPLGPPGSPSVLASGGTDHMIRLWALAGGSRGRSSRLGCLYGHEAPVIDLVVAGHNPSLLVSSAKDRKIRLWNIADGGQQTSCVGSIRTAHVPLALHCRSATCHIVCGDRVRTVDLRSMRQVASFAEVSASEDSGAERTIVRAAVAESGNLMCTCASDGSVHLWNLQRMDETQEPVEILSANPDDVAQCFVDSYRVITACTFPPRELSIWDCRSGELLSTIEALGCLQAMAASGHRVALAFESPIESRFKILDYSNCTKEIELEDYTELCAEDKISNRFWQS